MASSNGVPIRRNASQMFGIYRARTPDKMAMESKPSKQTRACFLTAVITGVALVVGLSLLDVSTNASNIKSPPVLHLTRHRHDLLPEERSYKNVNSSEDDAIVDGSVKEIKIAFDKNGTGNYNNITDLSTFESIVTNVKVNSNRTGRTQLFPVDSLKTHRTNTVKDYFIDGRHDPKSLGYYILQKQNGEYYLRNFSEPLWGTRIQRRFSNRIYPVNSQNYYFRNLQYIKRNDNLEYDTLLNRQIDHNRIKQELMKNNDYSYHMGPFRRLTSTNIDSINSRIQTRPSTYINQNKVTSNINLDNSQPPYEFTPIPIFSESYAQLDPYKHNGKIKSVQDVMKYLTVSPKINRPITTVIPQTIKPDDILSENSTKNNSATNSNYLNQYNKKRQKGIRFSGTYKMPLDPDDLKVGSSGIIETLLPPPLISSYAKPYSGNGFINGQAKSDPFANFRPSDPNEINYLLAPTTTTTTNLPIRVPSSTSSFPQSSSSTINNNRNKQTGSFINNNNIYAPTTIPPNRFFPKPSVYDYKKHPTRPGNEFEYDQLTTPLPQQNGHTIAVFKPNNEYKFVKNNNNENTLAVFNNKRPPYQNIKRKRKPVSVTLDIYPMTMDDDQEKSPSDNRNNNYVKSQYGKFKNENGDFEWVSPTLFPPTDENEDSAPSSSSDSHMVVHLNLFPKEITRKYRGGVGRRPYWNTANIPHPRAMFSKQSADYPIEINDDYEYTSAVNPTNLYNNKNTKKNNIDYLDYDFQQEEQEEEIPISLYDDKATYSSDYTGVPNYNVENKNNQVMDKDKNHNNFSGKVDEIAMEINRNLSSNYNDTNVNNDKYLALKLSTNNDTLKNENLYKKNSNYNNDYLELDTDISANNTEVNSLAQNNNNTDSMYEYYMDY